MKICIAVSDLSHNCLGRGYLLARVLARRYQVRIVGPVLGKGIWPPCDRNDIEYTAVPGDLYPGFLRSAARIIAELAKTHVIYASKPRPTSFGLSLLTRLREWRPVILDIDDWELGFYPLPRNWRQWLHWGRRLRHPNTGPYIWIMEYLTGLADAITVSSSFLMRRYGGVMVPHGRDTDFLDPARYNIEAIRQELCLDKRKNIVFLGTPGPLKGLEDLIMAIRQLDRPEVRVLLVGAQEQSPFVQRLISLGGSSLEVRGYCPLEDIPRYLVAADLIVLPQRFASKNVAQVPAKLFDAMAMARPIISTAISDIPEILQDCGVVVPPGDVETLARQIARLLDHPEEAQELGLRAREKCIRNYSWNVMEETLANVLDQYE